MITNCANFIGDVLNAPLYSQAIFHPLGSLPHKYVANFHELDLSTYNNTVRTHCEWPVIGI